MAKVEIKKKGADDVELEKPTVVEVESEAKIAFKKMMEAYSKQNPVKYALKYKSFLKKLSEIK